MRLFPIKCWIINLPPLAGLCLLAAFCAIVPSHMAAQVLESRGSADVTFSDVSGRLSPTSSFQISGLSISMTEFWPNLGLIDASVSAYAPSTGFRTGLTWVKAGDIKVGNERLNLTFGDFTLDPFTEELAFSSLSTPSLKLNGLAFESRGKNHRYRVFGGSELLLEGLSVPLVYASGQEVIGADTRFALHGNISLTARVIWLSTQRPNQTTRDASGITIAAALPDALTNSIDVTWKPVKQLEVLSQIGFSRWKNGVDSSWKRSLIQGFLWDSNRLKAHATYVDAPASYLPVAGYYATARQGFFFDLTYHATAWLNTFASWTDQSLTPVEDPAGTKLVTKSGGPGVMLMLPGDSSLSMQYQDSTYISNASALAPASWQKAHLTTIVASRSFHHHTAHLNANALSTTGSAGPQGQNTLQFQEDVPIRQFTVTGAVRYQQSLGGNTTSGVYFSGGVQGSIKAFSFSEHSEFGSDLASKTLFASASTRSTSFGCQYRLKSWHFSADLWRTNLFMNLAQQPAANWAINGLAIPQNMSNQQWTAIFKVTKQAGWGRGAHSSSDVARYAEEATPRVGFIEGIVTLTHDHQAATFAGGVPVTLDGYRRVLTDGFGHYIFSNVGEGPHAVEVDQYSLPVDFLPDSGPARRLIVLASHGTVVNLTVRPSATLEGTVHSADPELLKGLYIRVTPGGQYTFVGADGTFSIEGMAEGLYLVSLGSSVSSEQIIVSPERVPVVMSSAGPNKVEFDVTKKVVSIPIRNVPIGGASNRQPEK